MLTSHGIPLASLTGSGHYFFTHNTSQKGWPSIYDRLLKFRRTKCDQEKKRHWLLDAVYSHEMQSTKSFLHRKPESLVFEYIKSK